MRFKSTALFLSTLLCCAAPLGAQKFDYRLLATSRTSTMEKEMNQAADAGFVFGGVMGGESSIGGKEVIVVMTKDTDAPAANKKYKLLATSRTGTLQKELQQAGDEGFEYCGQTVFESTFGGREVAVILERSADDLLSHQPNHDCREHKGRGVDRERRSKTPMKNDQSRNCRSRQRHESICTAQQAICCR